MAEVLLLHHANGLTPGVRAFADELREAGHVVHTPDVYDGNTFTDLAEGVAYAKQVGFGELFERGKRAAERRNRSSASEATSPQLPRPVLRGVPAPPALR